MYRSVYDLKTFYLSEIGQIVRDILLGHIRDFWPSTHDLRILGCGYPSPYLEELSEGCERVFAMMPRKQGADHWGYRGDKNVAFLSDDHTLPIETCSVDRVLLIHHLECCDHLPDTLREVWRVLKANGRLLVIVPNRTGVWARADWSPFGQGSPFTLSQICHFLRDNLFVQENVKSALFVPPLPDSPVMMRSAHFIERTGRRVLPFAAGVHMVEASKQIYAGVNRTGSGSSVLSQAPQILGVKGNPAAQNSLRKKF
ncbi:MAG: class I SAM-dependent methyltransferase [Alphaproteobacteria bacterium]